MNPLPININIILAEAQRRQENNFMPFNSLLSLRLCKSYTLLEKD
jgi:hypothetical protein